MKKTIKWETEDGCLYNTEKEARQHEEYIKQIEWYDTHSLFADYCKVGFKDLAAWIKHNAEFVEKILNKEMK